MYGKQPKKNYNKTAKAKPATKPKLTIKSKGRGRESFEPSANEGRHEPEFVGKIGMPGSLSEDDRVAARYAPVPLDGVIPTPYVDWNAVPENAKLAEKDAEYYDYATPSAPRGFLKMLREDFKRNRLYAHRKPTNTMIVGPPGTGKTSLVRAFAAQTGLPYWQVIGQDGLTAQDLLGSAHIKNGEDVWVDGIIPRAVRTGGILHFDEVNVFPPQVLMRLNELMDAKRQLNMQDLNGEILKAHPDLFIIFTKNPDNYNGVNPLPTPITNRSKIVWMPFAPENIELNILKQQLRSLGIKPDEFEVDDSGKNISGRYGKDIADFVKIIDNLRKNHALPMHPSMRQTQDFAFALKDGYDFKTAFAQTIGDSYIAIDEDQYKPAMEVALRAVRR